MKLGQEHITYLVEQTSLMTSAAADAFEFAFRTLRKSDINASDEVLRLSRKVQEYHDNIERVLIDSHQKDRDVRDIQQMAALLKIILHMNRIGKTTLTIAKGGVSLYGGRCVDAVEILDRMGAVVMGMLQHIAHTTVNRDLSPLYGFGDMKNSVSDLNDFMLSESAEYIRKHPEAANDSVYYLSMAKCIVDIADDACKVAELCIFAETNEYVELH